MLRKLLQFEWHCHTRSVLLYATFTVFFLLGVLVSKGNFSFTNAYQNSPYVVSYIIGLMSMILIFSMTLFVAQTQLKDKETKFDSIIYATPVTKFNYLIAQFLSVFLVGLVSFLLFIFGLALGIEFLSVNRELGPFSISNYIVGAVVFAIPNAFLIASLLTSLAWISRSKLIIYVGGLFIYILYVLGSIFSNSPIFAGASPATPEAMSLMAKLDPFGLAAFFEQTRYWTAFQKNNQFISITGNLLFNRALWIFISLLITFISYRLFSFRKMNSKSSKKEKETSVELTVPKFTKLQKTEFQTLKHNLDVLKSFVKIDTSLIIKGIPFILIVILLTGLLTIEIKDEINGGIRMAESITTTGLIITTILDRLPFMLVLILLFYSNELVWRSESAQFGMLENVTPHNQSVVFLSKLISLWVAPFLLILMSILIGISFQLIKGNAPIEMGLYLSLFYFIGLPMLLVSILILCIQTIIQNKYLGLVVASVIAVLFCTSVGKLLNINYPLFRFAETLKAPYFDMNGFGSYLFSFHIKMLFNVGFALILLIFAGILWKRSEISIKKALKSTKTSFFQKGILALGGLFLMSFGSYIFYEVNVKNSYLTKEEQQNWSQQYEEKYKKFEDFAQPTITSVKANVDLFPESNSYNVKGSYQLVNNTNQPMDSLLVYIDENVKLKSMIIPNSKLLEDDSHFGHYWYKLNRQLQPKESLTINFSFHSSWSPFKGHTSFNSILDNGSFMRISRYFPIFGYQSENEIGNNEERTKRKMKLSTSIKKLEDAIIKPYDFIDFEAVVSTSKDQIVIGSGDLIRQWKSTDRNYFHYKSDRKMPFRFAFSSAKYEVKKELYKGISIEVYHDKRHHRNIEELIRLTKRTLDYCQTNFGKYPHKVIRYAEISAFVEGFAATAYPGTIYMKENFGFYSDISRGDKEDIINQLAGHELSHQWWGNVQFSPEQKEGSWILTETLAQYTELMLYEKRHGKERAMETVGIHMDLYLSSRSLEDEMPLYKCHYDTPHLPYNKGMVIMHQLRLLIGEANLNKVLKTLITSYAFPKKPADTRDLINEIYKISPKPVHPKIDEMFKQIITYSSKVELVKSQKKSNKKYEVTFEISSQKFKENSKGNRQLISNDATIDVGIYDENRKLIVQSFPIKNNRVKGKITVLNPPSSIIIDPNLKNIDTFIEDNQKEIN